VVFELYNPKILKKKFGLYNPNEVCLEYWRMLEKEKPKN